MIVFKITLTMDDGQIITLPIHKSDTARIFLGPQTSFVKYGNNLSDSELNDVFSIIKHGIVDYANANDKVKHCTIIDKHNNITKQYDFNMSIINNSTDTTITAKNYNITLYDYIVDASIEYNFNKIKTFLCYQLNKQYLSSINTLTLEVILKAIVARLDIAHLTYTKYQLPITEDDLTAILDVIDSTIYITSTINSCIQHIKRYIDREQYIPYHELVDARKILMPMYI